ncbi:hypothetical protein, partial [Endozoicomonas sp. SESOKO1]|uniref:hypothetical protein n=1 Tax=Endozoicomonas sp. SESOKO1 TaxID=2828742 RepID=UPI002147DB4C
PTSPPTSPTTIPPGCRGEPIPVQSSNDLAKIGKEGEPCFPPNGNYTQTDDFVAGNHRPIPDFTGKYNGNDKRIGNLNDCVFKNMKGDGKVHNLVIQNSHIERSRKDNDALGFIACTMEGESSQENNRVQHSSIKIKDTSFLMRKQNRQVGMLAGEIKANALLNGCRVEHSAIEIQGRGINAGMVTGQALGTSVINNTNIERCNVSLSGYTGYRIERWHEININVGLVAGRITGDTKEKQVTVSKSTLTDNSLDKNSYPRVFNDDTPRYNYIFLNAANVGGVAGKAEHAVIGETDARNNKIALLSMDRGHTAAVVADAHHCEIRGTIASNNRIGAGYKWRGDYDEHNPGLVGVVTAGCFNSEIENTEDINSTLVNQGAQNFKPSLVEAGHAAVAAAFSKGCTIRNTTANGTRIETNGKVGSVAIAAAFNKERTKVHQTTAIDCQLSAIGPGRDGRNTIGNAAVAVAV